MTQAQKNKDDNGGASPKLPMDIKHIKSLIELMVEHDLSRIELSEGETHILLRRGQPVYAGHAGSALAAAPPAQTTTATAVTVNTAIMPAAPAPAAAYIRSPMVGTFYTAADPESPPFVDVGSAVEPNTVVCLIEAMKVFNELKAEVSGRIAKVLVKNAEAVEFDQPLFELAPV